MKSARLPPILIALAALVLIAPEFRAAAGTRGISEEAVAKLAPEGYVFQKHVPWGESANRDAYRVAAFSDANEERPGKPVLLSLLRWRNGWSVLETIGPHTDTEETNPRNRGLVPNYFWDLDPIRVSGKRLILARTTAFGGGSGSWNYFDLYDVRGDHLRLVKSFAHGRFEAYYFAQQGDAVYDADLVCKRIASRRYKRSHACHLLVTKYRFDGEALIPAGTERLMEKTGDFALCDEYRVVSVKRALERGEIFQAAPAGEVVTGDGGDS